MLLYFEYNLHYFRYKSTYFKYKSSYFKYKFNCFKYKFNCFKYMFNCFKYKSNCFELKVKRCSVVLACYQHKNKQLQSVNIYILISPLLSHNFIASQVATYAVYKLATNSMSAKLIVILVVLRKNMLTRVFLLSCFVNNF